MTVRQPLAGESDFGATVGPWTFTREPVITGEAAEMFFGLYSRAFDPMKTHAAARQVLTRAEFFAHLADPRVDKYVARESGSEPVGVTTLTKHLEAVPWISSEYFAARYPEEWSRNAVYYLGFTLYHPLTRHGGLVRGGQEESSPIASIRFLEALIQAGIEPLAAEGAVIAYDVCTYNNEVLNLPDRISEVLNRYTTVDVEVLDTQVYYGVSFR